MATLWPSEEVTLPDVAKLVDCILCKTEIMIENDDTYFQIAEAYLLQNVS